MYVDAVDLVKIGRIGSPYGVRGWVRVYSDTQPLGNILDYRDWLLQTVKVRQQCTLEKVKPHRNGFIAKFRGINNRDQAALIANSKIIVHREALPELDDGEYYWTDLLGLEVTSNEGNHLGIITNFFETGANDVLVIKGRREYLIPYVPNEYILEINRKKKTMIVQWDLDF